MVLENVMRWITRICPVNVKLLSGIVLRFMECNLYLARRKLHARKIMFHIKSTSNLYLIIFCRHNFIPIEPCPYFFKLRILRFIR